MKIEFDSYSFSSFSTISYLLYVVPLSILTTTIRIVKIVARRFILVVTGRLRKTLLFSASFSQPFIFFLLLFEINFWNFLNVFVLFYF